jgi:H+/Cl- antiporter ClcA
MRIHLEAILRDVQFSFQATCGTLVSKWLLTAICLGSGLVGGIFALALFLGEPHFQCSLW